jgi:endonuclease/exonuclease/phosphatase family metal-dependent hydrolase
LRDRQQPAAEPLALFNTHFDHLGATAREESARLLREKIAVLGKDCAVIVTGDFNTDEGSPPYRALFGPVDDQPSPVVDSYRAAHPERAADEGTFCAFNAATTRGARIDWIGVSRHWQIKSVVIDRTAREGHTPSDHFPVEAVLRRP